MANPNNITITENTWTKVIDAKKSGYMVRRNSLPAYYITTRDAGDTAPTGSEGRRAFVNAEIEYLSDTADRDVYMLAQGDDGIIEVTV